MEEDGGSLVLLVDDNRYNLDFVGAVLRKEAYEIEFSRSGKHALEFIHSVRMPTLVLLDVMMPDMDGYEVCRRLKNDVVTKHIPVIFLTAKMDTPSIVKGFECGGVDYVTKPFRAAELLARVNTHIELAKARETIRTLRGIIPTCAHCKNIRNPDGKWVSLEHYVDTHTEARLSHGICPICFKKLYPDVAAKDA